MFSCDDEQSENGLHYKTVMINWLFNPGISCGEMAQESEALWKQYYDFAIVPGVGKKAPSVSWTEWRERIEAGTSFLYSAKWKKRPVQFIVETQLLLRPFLEGRKKMHLIYKIIRTSHPLALFNEFRTYDDHEDSIQSYEVTKKMALRDVEESAQEGDVNKYLDWTKKTLLSKHSNSGNQLAVMKLMSFPSLDVNLPTTTGETPLYLAARSGHTQVVELLLQLPQIAPNNGTENMDTPLHVAASKGYMSAVHALLKHPATDVNLVKKDGTSPLYAAAQRGQPGIVAMLLASKNININCRRISDSTTPLHSAICYGHREAVSMLCAARGSDVNLASANHVTPLGIALYYAGNPTALLEEDDMTVDDVGLDAQRKLSGADAIKSARIMFAHNAPLKHLLNAETEKKRSVMKINLRGGVRIRPSQNFGRRPQLHLGTRRGNPKTRNLEEDRIEVLRTLLRHPDVRRQASSNTEGSKRKGRRRTRLRMEQEGRSR
jgi:ankyrin repeat protein